MERYSAGLDLLVSRLKELSPHIVALEATGGFETVVATALTATTLPIFIFNPTNILSFTKAIRQLTKSDPIDADFIAHFA